MAMEKQAEETKEGNTVTHHLMIGAFVCETTALVEKVPLKSTVKAMTDLVIYTIKEEDLVHYFKKNPGIFVIF